MNLLTRVCLVILTPVFSAILTAKTLMIDDFSAQDLSRWQTKEFQGTTVYNIVTLDGNKVLEAKSVKAASGLYKKLKVDLTKTAYLNWRWRIENKLPLLIETEKSGDDYAARIYVVVSTGFFFWQTKALNYAWSSQMAPAASWPNAFAPNNALMIPIRTRQDTVAIWYTEKRNIYQELRQWLGNKDFSISGIAIMTDTDNSQEKVTAYYDDIYFSSQ